MICMGPVVVARERETAMSNKGLVTGLNTTVVDVVNRQQHHVRLAHEGSTKGAFSKVDLKAEPVQTEVPTGYKPAALNDCPGRLITIRGWHAGTLQSMIIKHIRLSSVA